MSLASFLDQFSRLMRTGPIRVLGTALWNPTTIEELSKSHNTEAGPIAVKVLDKILEDLLA